MVRYNCKKKKIWKKLILHKKIDKKNVAKKLNSFEKKLIKKMYNKIKQCDTTFALLDSSTETGPKGRE